MYKVMYQGEVVETFDDFEYACRKARALGNTNPDPVFVTKDGKELYRTS